MATLLSGTGLDKTDIVPDPRPSLLNSDVNWDSFDSGLYREHNYRTLRDDDQQIIHLVRDFFATTGLADAHGVDVGAGSNLYPALAMLPFCHRIDLCEFAASNVAWLRREIAGYDASWDRFWAEYAIHPSYARLDDPRHRLATVAHVQQVSIFDLPQHTWDIGTMFFVACSISTDIEEFNRAVTRFVGSLKAGAPFAAAFMLGSQGYHVGNDWFPAVSVDHETILKSFAGIARRTTLSDIETGQPLREGYRGMCLVTGWATD